MLIAFEEIGIKLNRFDPAEDMHNIRFLLRDTQPATEAKQDNVQFHRRIVKKRGRGLKNPVDAYPGGGGGSSVSLSLLQFFFQIISSTSYFFFPLDVISCFWCA